MILWGQLRLLFVFHSQCQSPSPTAPPAQNKSRNILFYSVHAYLSFKLSKLFSQGAKSHPCPIQNKTKHNKTPFHFTTLSLLFYIYPNLDNISYLFTKYPFLFLPPCLWFFPLALLPGSLWCILHLAPSLTVSTCLSRPR